MNVLFPGEAQLPVVSKARYFLPVLNLGIVSAAAAGVVLVLGGFLPPLPRGSGNDDRQETLINPSREEPWNSPMSLSGIRLPRLDTVNTLDIPIPDEFSVIGIVADGEARCYLIKGMQPFGHRVVNDRIGSTPITVIYSRRRDQARVLTQPGTEPVRLDMGGWTEGQQFFGYKYTTINFTGRFPAPIQEYPFERTTWKAWCKAHPDTKIFSGRHVDPSDNPDEASQDDSRPQR